MVLCQHASEGSNNFKIVQIEFNMYANEGFLKKAIQLNEMNIYLLSLKDLLSEAEYLSSNNFPNTIDNYFLRCSFRDVQENIADLISSLSNFTEESLMEADKLARVSGYVFNLDAKLVRVSDLSK